MMKGKDGAEFFIDGKKVGNCSNFKMTEEIQRAATDDIMNMYSKELYPLGGTQSVSGIISTEFSMNSLTKIMKELKEDNKKFIPNPIDFIQSDLLCRRIQFRFPRSKKKRIQNKWTKQEKNYRYKPMDEIFVSNKEGKAYCHPAIYNQILNANLNNAITKI